MKKTIAILLVLVLAGVGLFAAPTPGITVGTAMDGSTASTKADLIITTHVLGEALFGLSVEALDPADYISSEAFSAKVSGNLTQDFVSADDLVGTSTLGYISGFNTSSTAFGLTIAISTLSNGTAIIPVLYAVGTEVTSNKVTAATTLATLNVAEATSELGKLESTKITVTGAKTDIDLAPEGNYEATITFTTTAS